MIKNKNKLLLYLPFVICLVIQPAVAFEVIGGTKEDQAAFEKIYQTWFDAYLKGDMEKLMSILSEEVIIMPASQPTVKGKRAAREYFAPRIGRPGVEFTDDLQEVRIQGNWGYVYGNFTVEIAAKEADKKPFVHNGRYFVLYEKGKDGKWKVSRDIDNTLPKNQ